MKTTSQQHTRELLVYGSGQSKIGELGIVSNQPVVQLIDLKDHFAHVNQIRQVGCGNLFTYILTHDHRLFCSGLSDLGQCASILNRSYFQEVFLPTDRPPVISHLSCGENFVVVVTGRSFRTQYKIHEPSNFLLPISNLLTRDPCGPLSLSVVDCDRRQ